jgi:hypothetical protein
MTRISPPDTPFKGLVPYDEEDAPFFFGRDPERQIITANLKGSPLTLLYGPSGAGKSSVLRAGVVHHLREMARRQVATNGRPKFVPVFFNEWRDDPLAGLRAQLRRDVEAALGPNPPCRIPPSTPLAEELKLWADCVGGKLLVVLDQFEEYFLYPQREGEGSFAEEFARAVNRADVRANFIVSLREDWLAKLDRFKVSIPTLFDNYLRVRWLDAGAARLAIEKPVEKYNSLAGNGMPAVEIAEGFSDKVIEQLSGLTRRGVLGDSGAAGDGAADTLIQTPYLQLVMRQLWGEALRAEGHVLHPDMLRAPLDPGKAETRAEEIIQSHLDGVMGGLQAGEQEVAARAFYYLVTPGGTKIALSVGDLAAFTDLPRARLEPVLDNLSRKETAVLSRLAPPPDHPHEFRYEIFHDVLAPAILDWRARFVQEQAEAEARARAEADAQAEAEKRIAHELAQREKEEQQREYEQAKALAAAEKARAEEKERRFEAERLRAEAEGARAAAAAAHASRLKGMVAVLVVLLLAAVGSAAAAFVQGRRAERNARLAEENAKTAEMNASKARESEQKARENEQTATKFAKESETLRGEAETLKTQAEGARQEAVAQSQLAMRRLGEARQAKAEAGKERIAAERAKQEALQAQIMARLFQAKADYQQRQAAENLRNAEEAEKRAKQLRQVNLAFADAGSSSSTEAVTKLEAALKLLPPEDRDDDDRTARAFTYKLLGVNYNGLGQPSEAAKYYEKALPLYKEVTDKNAEASVLNSLASIYDNPFGSGDRQKAAAYYKEAVAAYGLAGKRDEQADMNFKLAVVYHASEKAENKIQASTEFDNAINVYEKGDDRRLETILKVAKHYKDSAVFKDSGGKNEDNTNALKYYNQAAREYEALGKKEEAAGAYVQAGDIYADLRSRTAASSAYNRALSLYEKNKGEQAATLLKLGQLWASLGSRRGAEVYYRRAGSLFPKDSLERASNFERLAQLFECDDCTVAEKRKAIDYYWELAENYRQSASMLFITERIRVINKISELYKALGDKKNAKEYKDCAENLERGKQCKPESGVAVAVPAP